MVESIVGGTIGVILFFVGCSMALGFIPIFNGILGFYSVIVESLAKTKGKQTEGIIAIAAIVFIVIGAGAGYAFLNESWGDSGSSIEDFVKVGDIELECAYVEGTAPTGITYKVDKDNINEVLVKIGSTANLTNSTGDINMTFECEAVSGDLNDIREATIFIKGSKFTSEIDSADPKVYHLFETGATNSRYFDGDKVQEATLNSKTERLRVVFDKTEKIIDVIVIAEIDADSIAELEQDSVEEAKITSATGTMNALIKIEKDYA